MDKFTVNERTLFADEEQLSMAGVKIEDVACYLPQYLLHPTVLHYGWLKYSLFLTVRVFLAILVWVFLRPRVSKVGKLDQLEVDTVYNREAITYNWKHSMTTRGMDMIWRRAASWFVVAFSKNKGLVRILDLCTGTGLVIQEMVPILKQWDIKADIVGVDFNEQMLRCAKMRHTPPNVKFVHGDATNLVKGNKPPTLPGMIQFDPNSFDVITQMCGIGGIPEPLLQFIGVLKVLKNGGQFWMHDMHKPIPELPGEWPIFLKWFRFPRLESYVYEDVCLPLVLKRLWGWRDPTPYYYLLPLMTYRDKEGQDWGFKIVSFVVEPQRWWFGIPCMPTATIVVEKVELDETTALKRKAIMSACHIMP